MRFNCETTFGRVPLLEIQKKNMSVYSLDNGYADSGPRSAGTAVRGLDKHSATKFQVRHHPGVRWVEPACGIAFTRST
jgi:hypothetical protein